MVEEFDCGNHAIFMYKNAPSFGVSKEDFLVSSKHTINSMFFLVNHGS